jgi:hypothetical protein
MTANPSAFLQAADIFRRHFHGGDVARGGKGSLIRSHTDVDGMTFY